MAAFPILMAKHRMSTKKKTKGSKVVVRSSKKPREVDLRPFYTVWQAAVQVLCWLHGVKRRKYISDVGAAPREQYPFLDTLIDSFHPLMERVVRTRTAFWISQASGVSTKEIQKLHDEHNYYQQIADLYASYSDDLQQEFLNLENPELTFEDDNQGTFVRRFDLHEWICRKYHVKLIGSAANRLPDLPEADELGGSAKQSIVLERKSGIPADEPEDKRNEKGGLGRIGADSLFTTLGFLIEAFVRSGVDAGKGNAYRLADGTPNVKAIATHLEQQAVEARSTHLAQQALKARSTQLAQLRGKTPPEDPVRGQGFEMIRKRLTEALEIKHKAIIGK